MNSTTDSYPRFLKLKIEDYYIDLHTYSYSKQIIDVEQRKEINNMMIVNIWIHNKYIINTNSIHLKCSY